MKPKPLIFNVSETQYVEEMYRQFVCLDKHHRVVFVCFDMNARYCLQQRNIAL